MSKAILSLIAIIAFAAGIFLIGIYVIDVCGYGWNEFGGFKGMMNLALLTMSCFLVSFVSYSLHKKIVRSDL